MADQPETTDPQTTADSKPSGGSWWYPLLAVLLSAALITQIVYLFRQVKTPAPSPRAGKSTSGQQASTAKGPSPGANPSGQPGPGQAGPANETPYVGGAPTADPSTWTYVPGSFLLAALKRIDGQPGLALSAAQCKQIDALFKDAAPLGRAQAEADQKLTRQAQTILTGQQCQEIQSKQKEIAAEAFDGDALVAGLKKLAARGGASAAPENSEQGAMVPIVLLLGLNHLMKADKLTPSQAAQLEPLVAAYVDALKAVSTQIYPRVPKILNEKQMQAFVGVLGDIRSGKIDPANAQMTLEEMTEYLKPRLQ